jgi:hypothetical protein
MIFTCSGPSIDDASCPYQHQAIYETTWYALHPSTAPARTPSTPHPSVHTLLSICTETSIDIDNHVSTYVTARPELAPDLVDRPRLSYHTHTKDGKWRDSHISPHSQSHLNNDPRVCSGGYVFVSPEADVDPIMVGGPRNNTKRYGDRQQDDGLPTTSNDGITVHMPQLLHDPTDHPIIEVDESQTSTLKEPSSTACPSCKHRFARRWNMLVHLRIRHGNTVPRFACSDCPTTCSRLRDVRRHRIRKHGPTTKV